MSLKRKASNLSCFLGKIPYTVATIGDEAFHGCTSLEEVVTSAGTTQIGASAFEGCSELKNVTLDTNITKIGEKAFADCMSIFRIRRCQHS